MPGLVLTATADPGERLDMTALSAHLRVDADPTDLARQPIGTTRTGLTVGDVFRISHGRGDGPAVVIETAGARIDGLGAGLRPGQSVIVVGDVGDRAGEGLRGGTLEVRGSAGQHLGAGMASGLILITGGAGEGVGGLLPGRRFGMTGGAIVIEQGCGARAGEKMRRGLILTRGPAGPLAGARMLGGVIVAEGGIGPDAGRLMRRGTILAPSADGLGGTFADCGVHDLVILRVMMRDWMRDLGTLAPRLATSRVRRFAGDLATIGKGEVLIPV